jgi:hypothetical protein
MTLKNKNAVIYGVSGSLGGAVARVGRLRIGDLAVLDALRLPRTRREKAGGRSVR